MSSVIVNPDWKLRQEERTARGHLQWAKEEAMKLGAKIMQVLKEVHDKRSYRFDFATFEEYCEKEWNMTARRANQIVAGENFRSLMIGAGDADAVAIPEGQLRVLAKVTPEKAVKVITKLRKTGKVTASRISQAIFPQAEPTEKAARIPCPHCGQFYTPKKTA